MKKRTNILIISLFPLILSGCNNTQKIKIKTLSGYISWQQNNWSKSTSSFYKALNLSSETKNEELSSYSKFNIASTYLMQNEDESAYIKLSEIKEIKNKKLMSSVFYQKGIIAFKNKNYKKATEFFKKSIQYDASYIDAKINYELCKKYLNSKYTNVENQKLNNIDKKNKDITDSTIMNLIRKKEKNECITKSREEKKSFTNDY